MTDKVRAFRSDITQKEWRAFMRYCRRNGYSAGSAIAKFVRRVSS